MVTDLENLPGVPELVNLPVVWLCGPLHIESADKYWLIARQDIFTQRFDIYVHTGVYMDEPP